MMTTMAALLGGVPLMLGTGTGSEIRQPLGYAMVGGLIVSQALTLFTTPVIYIYLDRLSDLSQRAVAGQSGHARVGSPARGGGIDGGSFVSWRPAGNDLAERMDRDHEPAAGNANSSARGARILQFKRRVTGLKMAGLKTPQRPITDPLRHFEDEEDRRRMQQNLAAALVIALLIMAGFWLIDHLRESARIAACVEAGHRNCVPLDFGQGPGRLP